MNNVNTNHGKITRVGFNTAVDIFCSKAAGQKVGADKYLSMATRVWLDYGGAPDVTGINGYIFFEVHNKRATEHTVDGKLTALTSLTKADHFLGEKCKEFLKHLSSKDSKCYGPDHDDTKGGTWQVGNNDVSYHALANKVPPTFDSLDKTVILGSAIQPLSMIKGNQLEPFPTYVFNDITPVPCHSHNDYTRDAPLYSALSAGCMSVEADIWVHGDKLIVGHLDPGSDGPTLDDLYIKPLKKLIDERKAVFPAHPSQSLSLLIDFKSKGDETWDRLVNALAPLRNAGYLSYWDTSFKQRYITVIASGAAIANTDTSTPSPLPKALDTTTNPQRAIFVDARIDKDMTNFNASNAFYASAKFSDAVPDGLPISGNALAKLKQAKDKGFKIRYWDIPGKDKWQMMVDEGVDRLNVDDLQDVASLDWHL